MPDVATPLVSVVIPCLNRAPFLVPTIESVLQQDYPNIECIVVDGGSTDGTVEVLRRYESRITWISEPDNGHADAINKGWKRSRGEVLAWLNADDLWAVPNAVKQAVEYLGTHPEIDTVYGDNGYVDASGRVTGFASREEWHLEYAVEHCRHIIAQPAAFIRRRVLERVNWLDTNFYQKKDHDLWLRIGLIGTIRHIPVVLAYVRDHPANLGRDAKSGAKACIQLTKKFFSLPNIPQHIMQKRRRAISNANLRAAEYCLGYGLRPLFLKYMLMAMVSDPSNVPRLGLRLNHRFWSMGSARATALARKLVHVARDR